jgi:HK97 gp10 family phage protein
MENSDFDIGSEINSAIDKFRKYGKQVDSKLEKALTKSAMIVERNAKKLFRTRLDESIDGLPPRVQTGLLRSSITHRLETEEGKPVAFVGTNVEYGKWLEFPNSRTKKTHPFMRPALEMSKSEIQKIIAEGLKA